MIEITMPRLSDTMQEGAITTWLKQPGDRVEVGDVLVEIETDKANMELEAYEAGTLAKILVPEGELVPIGTPIALLDDGKRTADHRWHSPRIPSRSPRSPPRRPRRRSPAKGPLPLPRPPAVIGCSHRHSPASWRGRTIST
jgi:pyruvate/2-oxoglutarate dehydrogenase complex dihydrolipoamide acyltransferase (E2) component